MERINKLRDAVNFVSFETGQGGTVVPVSGQPTGNFFAWEDASGDVEWFVWEDASGDNEWVEWED